MTPPRWLPEDPIECLQEAIKHLDFAPTTQEDQQQVEAALDALRARIVELEAREWDLSVKADSRLARIAELEAGIREYLKSENDGVEGHCGDPNCDICQQLAGLYCLLNKK